MRHFDDEATAECYETEFPELCEAPMEKTRKGRHYFFERPKFADEEGFFDGARQQGDQPVDFKSKCSTGTAGLVVVCPSANKTWVRPPWAHAPKEISRALLERVCKPRSRTQKKASDGARLHDLVDVTRPISREDHVVKLLHLLSKTR